MEFAHTMVRVHDLKASLHFYIEQLGLKEIKRHDHEKGRFTLVFVGTGPDAPLIELTHNWDDAAPYEVGRQFGHIAFWVDDLYATCEALQAKGVTLLRPPRDGHLAFIRSPENTSIELLQRGERLPVKAPWDTMPNAGTW